VASEEQLDELARQLGVDRRSLPPPGAAAAAAAAPPAEFRLWSEHVDAARLFDAACTQWRYAGMEGVPTGLDYAGVRATGAFGRLPAERRDQVMDDLHWIELGWLAEHRRRAAEQRARGAMAGRPPGPQEPDD